MASKHDRYSRPRYRSDCPSPEPLDERRTYYGDIQPAPGKKVFSAVVRLQKRTEMSSNINPRKCSSHQYSHDAPQKRAKLIHDVHAEHEATAYKALPSFKPRCALKSRHSEKENGMIVGVGQGGTSAEDMESLPTTTKLPEVYSSPRIDRRQGRQDEAAGPNYAVHDSVTNEVAGDTRAEMPYLACDRKIAGLLSDLWNSVDSLSRDYFSDVIPDAEMQKWLKSIPRRLHPKRAQDCDFVDLVTQITVGGPCGTGSWEQTFLEPELRRGLVCGVIWRKLKLEVFDKMLFGGTNSQEEELLELEKSMAEHSDGFLRTRARGLRVREMLDFQNPPDHYITLDSKHDFPRKLDQACQTVTKQLQGLLSCLTPATTSSQILTALEEITCKAALLSYRIRLDTETIYYFPYIEKDSCPGFSHAEENITYFSAEHKEWLWSPENRADKTVACPQNGLSEEKVKRIYSYDPLIRIICSGPVEAYRKGGWRPNDADKGVRKRILFPARAIFRWGRPQEKSSLPSGHQEPVSEVHDCPASYISFRQALGYLGSFRDTVAEKTFGEARGSPWYLHDHLQNGVRDPAWSVEGYPVLGGRGTGNQPFGLEKFQPSRMSMF